MNNCTFAGRVGADADLRSTSGGTSVANFSLAIDRMKRGGEKQPPLWVKVTLWGKQAENLADFITKGKQIVVSGELDLKTYETKSGEQRSELTLNASRVTLLGSGQTTAKQEEETPEIREEDIPF